MSSSRGRKYNNSQNALDITILVSLENKSGKYIWTYLANKSAAINVTVFVSLSHFLQFDVCTENNVKVDSKSSCKVYVVLYC